MTVQAETPSPQSPLLVVAVALVDPDGRVLLAERPDGKAYAGYWEFPGGKIEAGETPEEALIRELGEELGIETHASCLAPLQFSTGQTQNGTPLILMLYICRRWQGRADPREGGQLKWVPPARLRDYQMPPPNLPFIAALQDLLL